MLARPRSMVGLDIGASAIKAVELTQSGRDLEVTGFGQVEHSGDDQDARVQAVRDLISEGGFKTRHVVTGISGKQVIVRYLSIVRMSDEELRNAITFEAEKYVPFPLDDCVIDCQRLEPTDEVQGGNMTVVLVAAKRSQLDDHLSTLSAVGVTPEVVDVDAFALSNAHSMCGVMDEGMDASSTTAFVDIGHSKTSVNVVSGGCSMFTREIAIGGRDFTEAVSKRLNIGFDEAEDLKRNPGDGSDTVQDAVLPMIDDLGNEVQLSFDYFEGQFDKEISQILVSGGGSRVSGLEEALGRIFEKPTTAFNPFDHIKISGAIDPDLLASNASQLVVATGLAVRAARAS